ncbi:MAG: flagellar filament outer layer protein FlaA [Spirochaetales bacterium]|nr:flagellar filament outer layer protein FlaA [Spirochaetales bacterium]
MKRVGCLLCVFLLIASFAVYAEESVLIDFSTLTADEEGENSATLVDFSDKAGTSFTEEEKEHMKTSLYVENWGIQLASSSRTVNNQRFSMVKEAMVRDGASRYGGQAVMGVRIHFPVDPFNSWAVIRPPFDIPAYEGEDGNKFVGYGVVKNVGVLKSVSINVLGKNFPNGLGVILEDQTATEHNIFMGYLDFDGWRTLTWENPNYISDVRNRELRKYPLYPRTSPMMKLKGIIVYKDAAQEGGDFITYIKDISVTYDKAVLDLESDVDDEALWSILTDREEARRQAEYARLGNLQVLQYLEEQKMHPEPEEE